MIPQAADISGIIAGERYWRMVTDGLTTEHELQAEKTSTVSAGAVAS
jgi:hypothetical protein